MTEETINGVGSTAEDWRAALDRVVPAVVVIRMTSCRAFDTESAGSSSATGFVVDKRRGLILTNRHVVQPGPIVAEAMFVNREEVPVYPVYRDPVHDFGFFRYDPSAIQFLSYEEIPLAPEAACVGLDIRVVGNDSGEKLSILAGTLARMDRDAPKYGEDGYNDFNTFYLQAASGTKGGSSGSPVIDCQGRAIALNAGGRVIGASAFFLPLQRVVRALKFLQKGRDSSINNWEVGTIPRGTLQVTFIHKGFEETRRLGIRSETEQLVRQASPPEETGMLVVDSVVPDGPADKHLEAGDVLVRLNGEVTTQFLRVENLLDESVNQKVELQIERGGKPMTLNLMVQDLHSVTPDHFFEISGAVIHSLSYQQARNFRLPCGLVYVAEQGYMLYRAGLPRHAIIKNFAGQDISKLEDLISAISKLSKGARVPLEYMIHTDPHQTKSVLVTIDRHEWYAPPQIYTRNDSSGLWTMKPALRPESSLLSSPLANLIEKDFGSSQVSSRSSEITPNAQAQHVNQEQVGSPTCTEQSNKETLSTDQSNGVLSPGSSLDEPKEDNLKDTGEETRGVSREYQGTTNVTTSTSVAEHVVEPSLVMFEVHVPWSCMLDGVHTTSFWGTGVVIYHSPSMGLVAVDRNTVVVSVSDVMLSFAAYPIEIPGEVVFLHPTQNFAIVSYDSSALGAGASLVRAAELLPEPALCRGDSVYLVGLSKSQLITSRKSVITNACAASNVVSAKVPRYRAMNMELIELDTDLGSVSGVLTDELGRVQAIWGSFSTQLKQNYSTHNHEFSGGIPIYMISKILEKLISGDNPPGNLVNGTQRLAPLIRMLEVELHPTLLSKARSFGLSDAWIQVLMKKDPIRRQVLTVKLCLAGSKAEKLLEQGDMVLAINNEPVTCFRDIEDTCQDLDRHSNGNEKLTLRIFRQGNEIDIDLGTEVRDGKGTTRVINWCGGLLQDTHPAVRALGFLPEGGHGVYVARRSLGSPAQRYGLGDCKWIVEVNGKPTPDLDAFIAVTKEAEAGDFVRMKTIHLNGKPSVLTLKQDLHYWPTWELKFDPETAMWHRRTIKTLFGNAE